ncbi:MAG: hypothetical protein HRU81_02925 [Gammaproteobacteria bacterium]|nr:MAG: hypothetical protein HRU81_02925 [Gammaproteobacteria bacterium]
MATALYKQPVPGLVAFGVAFLSQWLGHSMWALLRAWFAGGHELPSLLLGLVGAVMIARSLALGEVAATWMAFLGAQFVWVGWFELTFEFYAAFFAWPRYVAAPGLEAAGSVTFLISTLPIFATVFLLYGFYNRQTKCNLIRWFHRNLRMTPGMPTSGNGRSMGRIVAMETLFVVWACYLFWLYVSFIGANQSLMVAAYAGWASWFGYIFWKLLRFPKVGPAFRYGIPVGIVAWGLMEMPSYMGLYDEVWLKPVEYPLTTIVVTAVYAAGIVYIANPPDRAPRDGSAQTAAV